MTHSEEIRNIRFKTLCLSRNSRAGHTSGDVIIEEVNKEAKRDLVSRVEVVKASLDLTGKYPNTDKGRIGFLDECN